MRNFICQKLISELDKHSDYGKKSKFYFWLWRVLYRFEFRYFLSELAKIRVDYLRVVDVLQ